MLLLVYGIRKPYNADKDSGLNSWCVRPWLTNVWIVFCPMNAPRFSHRGFDVVIRFPWPFRTRNVPDAWRTDATVPMLYSAYTTAPNYIYHCFVLLSANTIHCTIFTADPTGTTVRWIEILLAWAGEGDEGCQSSTSNITPTSELTWSTCWELFFRELYSSICR